MPEPHAHAHGAGEEPDYDHEISYRGIFEFIVGLFAITAVAMAIRRNIAGHRRWMLRSIALTFSGVTLRVILGAGMAAGFPFMTVYLVAAWSAWPLNLLVMESYLRLESARRLRPAGLMQPRDTGSASGPQIA